MTDKLPKVSIVVVTWNSGSDAFSCFDSLRALDYPDYEIVIVDNGSTEQFFREIAGWLAKNGCQYGFVSYGSPPWADLQWMEHARPVSSRTRVHFIETGKNLGFTGGNNIGIAYALERGSEYVLILNPDTVVSRDCLTEMVRTAERSPRVGLVGCKICAANDPARVTYAGGSLSFWLGISGPYPAKAQKRGEAEVNFVPGCAVLIKRALLEAIGSFQESYFAYTEDIEFSLRAVRSGWQARVNLDAVIAHNHLPGMGTHSLAYYYYGTRNSLYLITKYFRGLQRGSCLAFYLAGRGFLIMNWLWKGRRQHIRAALSGIADFLRGNMGSGEEALARLEGGAG